jgi:hypothetical protein
VLNKFIITVDGILNFSQHVNVAHHAKDYSRNLLTHTHYFVEKNGALQSEMYMKWILIF